MPIISADQHGKDQYFDLAKVRQSLSNAFSEIQFCEEETFLREMKKIDELPQDERPSQTVIDGLARKASRCGPTHAFRMSVDDMSIYGYVNKMRTIFVMESMPREPTWQRLIDFASSLDADDLSIDTGKSKLLRNWGEW